MADCQFNECDGSGFVVDTEARTTRACRCRPARIAKAKARRLSSVIPKKFQGVSFDRAPVINMDPRVVGEVRDYVTHLDRNLETGRGLWLMGDVGTGKTTLAMVVCRAALERGHTVAIYSLPRLLSTLRMTFSDATEARYDEVMDALCSVDLLHIDDVGAENQSDWVLEQLYTIVNTRYEEEKAISITTNLDPTELAAQIHERTVSRLIEICGEQHRVTGPDARKEPPIPAHLAQPVGNAPFRYGQAPS